MTKSNLDNKGCTENENTFARAHGSKFRSMCETWHNRSLGRAL